MKDRNKNTAAATELRVQILPCFCLHSKTKLMRLTVQQCHFDPHFLTTLTSLYLIHTGLVWALQNKSSYKYLALFNSKHLSHKSMWQCTTSSAFDAAPSSQSMRHTGSRLLACDKDVNWRCCGHTVHILAQWFTRTPAVTKNDDWGVSCPRTMTESLPQQWWWWSAPSQLEWWQLEVTWNLV